MVAMVTNMSYGPVSRTSTVVAVPCEHHEVKKDWFLKNFSLSLLPMIFFIKFNNDVKMMLSRIFSCFGF